MATDEQSAIPAGVPGAAPAAAGRVNTGGGLASWLPWILFGFLSGFGYWEVAVALGLITALYPTLVRVLRGASAKLVDWTMLAFFAISAVLVLAVRMGSYPEYNAVLVWILFAAMGWGSVVLRSPFTLEFARESTPEALWSQPLFIRTNLIITLVWCAAFTINLIVALALLNPAGGTALSKWIVPAVTLIGAVIFTKRYAAAVQSRAMPAQG